MTTRRKKPLKKRQTHGAPPFPFEFLLQVARLHIEDGQPVKLIAGQFGISDYSVYRWSKRYRLWGLRSLLSFRAGIESGISLLKRCLGLTRCIWKGQVCLDDACF